VKHEPIEITRKQALAHTGRERWAGWYWSHSRVTPQTPDDVLLRVRPSQYPVRADARGPFPSRLKAEADIRAWGADGADDEQTPHNEPVPACADVLRVMRERHVSQDEAVRILGGRP